ncbi:ribonuclease H-like domain-containing protein [Tanacetum coccineum]
MGDENPIRTLGDYSKPSHEGYRNTIELPVGNNVVPLRSNAIWLVQNGCSFHRLRSEDPNQHLKDFFKLVDSLDLDGRTAKLRNDILMFQQHHGESLSEAWTRFKDLLQKVPHHGLDLWLQIQIFYDHVDYTNQMGINYAAGERLRKLRPNEAWATIEKLAQYKDEGWNDTFIPDEVSFNYKNPDIEQLLGIMELKDFLTRHILCKCDSSGDLYPVTSPSPTPHALLSMSPKKSSHLCHACQLGKHVRLPFTSSDSIITRSFEIVHSDIWTSPIASSDGFNYYGWFLVKSLCSSLFVYQHGSEVAYLLIYVDDIALTTSSTNLLQRIISSLHKEFDMTDLGALNYFLGISVTRDSTGMFLSQKKYALELLDRAHMANCNPTRTPVDTESKLGSDGDPISDPTLYRSLAGGLQYLTFTRPDISYAVQQVCLHMHDPREPHLAALKRVLRYVRGTLDFGLQLYASITGSLVAYTDADWAGCPTTRWSTSGYCVFLGDNLLSWSAKRQHTLSRLSVKAEYC